MRGARGDEICSARWGRRHDGRGSTLQLVRPGVSGQAAGPNSFASRSVGERSTQPPGLGRLTAIANGILAVADFKNSPAATRALALFAPESDAALPARRLMVAPGGPGADSTYGSQQDLETRMAAAVARMRRR